MWRKDLRIQHLGFMKEDSQKWSCNYLFMKSASLWGPGRNISHPLDTRGVWCLTQVPSPVRRPLPSGTDELSPKLRAPSGSSRCSLPGPPASAGAALAQVPLPARGSPCPVTGCCGSVRVQSPRYSWGRYSLRVHAATPRSGGLAEAAGPSRSHSVWLCRIDFPMRF